MSDGRAMMFSLGICLVAAALEALCAGKNVKSFFAHLRFPRYSAPLWLWSVIGGLYYVIFFYVIYRLLRLGAGSGLNTAALGLTLFMMAANALTNYVIFRARNLCLSFVVGAIFPIMDMALLVCLVQLDDAAALSLIPYLLYRIYAVWWGYSLWRLNDATIRAA